MRSHVAFGIIALGIAPSIVEAQRLGVSGTLTALPTPVVLDTAIGFRAVVARVGDDFFIAGQPAERALKDMRERGVTTVVNLRTPPEMKSDVHFDEPALVRQLGMKYVYLPVRGNDEYPYSPETVAAFAAAVRDANGKVLLHCTIGWRASHLWAAYLIAERGVPADSALANARAVNLMDEHHSGAGRMPVEDFLGRAVPELKRHSP